MSPSDNSFFEISYYHDYISPVLAKHLLANATVVDGISELLEIGNSGGLETKESFQFLIDVYESVKDSLNSVLKQRVIDRKFIDERVAACSVFNQELGREISDPDYKTIIGLEDSCGRIVMGPKSSNYCQEGGKPIAPIPKFLEGPHVTLFGPPGTARVAINAMNAYHRKLKDEPAIVSELLKTQTSLPKWGADDEDSKTPLREDLIEAGANLTSCFDGELSFKDETNEKTYALASDHLAIPIKRIPGLALPSTFLFYKKNPIPLHLYDFCLHLFRNWNNPEALVFYIPKLENEEEAAYIHKMISTAERMIKEKNPLYIEGTVRLMIVLENPRAILRTHEIIDTLYPYFVGASLGWHDFLGSTARIFKEDRHYRIPVKADPNIVIKYIQASHLLMADVVGSRGGIKVGGMYGILPLDTDRHSLSFQITLKGYIKDVMTQLKRNLTGFWVAHPDFMRLGLALVEAWRLYKDGKQKPLLNLVKELMNLEYREEIIKFIQGPDIEGLNKNDPNYVRSLIVADIKESDFIANNDPEEIRYNVFQSLQYLTDWLSGNGCVALPAIVNGVAVRVMDDLATAERSRWEVWSELHHGRFATEDFLKIVHEEMNFIRKDLSTEKKIVQVKWSDETKKWYPIAMQIMLQLMTDPNPVEFATELLMPFTVESIRRAQDPWQAMHEVDFQKYRLSSYVERFNYYFETCGALRFAKEMAKCVVFDESRCRQTFSTFTISEIREAAFFHGSIGENKKMLDPIAAAEQALVLKEEESSKAELRRYGEQYQNKFGFKFLISAKGKKADEILKILKFRLGNSEFEEIENARLALLEISLKRISEKPPDVLSQKIEELLEKYKVSGLSLAINNNGFTQELVFGKSRKDTPVAVTTRFEIASLSKTVASAFALEYFARRGVSISTSVNKLLSQTKSKFRIVSTKDESWADQVTLEHLMNHTALNMHYVPGICIDKKMPNVSELLDGNIAFGYEPVSVVESPGSKFNYSGGGYLVLQHLIESMESKPIHQLLKPFLKSLEIFDTSFQSENEKSVEYADGYSDSGAEIEGGRLMFPAFAAGATGTAKDMAAFLNHLTKAYQDPNGSGGISHDTAVIMLHGVDKGSLEFMGSKIGLGVFIGEAGSNKIAIHQGANDGFRALYFQCFSGPDQGKGFVLFCNSNNRGVLLNALIAQEIIKTLQITGIDYKKFGSSFNYDALKQEQIVNLGYKNLVFNAFEPNLPEKIVNKGPLNQLATFNLVVDSKIVSVTNQKFARAENLISAYEPVFDPELFGAQGKIMDSWETSRHNEVSDSLILGLKEPSQISFASISTKFHDGNHPEFIILRALETSTQKWVEIVPKTKLEGHSLLNLELKKSSAIYSYVQVEIFPDGGLTRLGLFKDPPPGEKLLSLDKAKSVRYNDLIPKSSKPLTIKYEADSKEIERNYLSKKNSKIDHASAACGGTLVRASNEHYGPAIQVISPYPPIHMFDGLESARSRKPGHFEEVVIRLGKRMRVGEVVVDFKYFVNNNPLFLSVDGRLENEWVELVPKTKVKAFAANLKRFNINSKENFQELRFKVYPDGGINRIKVYGSNLLA